MRNGGPTIIDKDKIARMITELSEVYGCNDIQTGLSLVAANLGVPVDDVIKAWEEYSKSEDE